ncbi:MAG: M24 family metallopeptidase [bacterium]
MVRMLSRACLLLLLSSLMPSSAAGQEPPAAEVSAGGALTSTLPLRERPPVIDSWLSYRLQNVLPEIMRREGIDMWIVDNREYNEDPVFFSLMPGGTMAARRRTILVICDAGEDRPLERLAVSRYGIGEWYRGVWEPEEDRDQYAALARVVTERDPEVIGINVSETFAFGDGLSAGSFEAMKRALPERYVDRLRGAEDLAVGWLEHRTRAEMEAYEGIVRIAHRLIAKAFSSEVIHPGITTSQDVVWWFREAFAGLDVDTWFQPSVEIIRHGEPDDGLPAGVIRHGDVLHCDIGITYLGMNTDTQQMAYVLRTDEEEVPKGLLEALSRANRLQDILMEEFVTGRTGNEVLEAARDRMLTEGLDGSIYTHPIGYYGHGPGPTIGLWDMQEGVPGKGDYPLHPRTLYAIELNCTTAVPEWEGRQVTIGLEQEGFFDGERCRFVDRRQTRFHLVR